MFFQLIGKSMVFNSKSSKKSNICLQDEKIYPVKLFVIVILHQSKWSITKPTTTKKSPTTDKRPPTNRQVLHRPSKHIKTDPTTTKPQPTDRFSTEPRTTDPTNILEPTQRPQNPNPLTGSPPIHQPPTHWPPTHRPPSK